jgi:hypothetical protein
MVDEQAMRKFNKPANSIRGASAVHQHFFMHQ